MNDPFSGKVDNDTMVMILERFQKDDNVHSFTCGNCPGEELVPEVKGDEVVLKCKNCSWEQIASPRIRKAMQAYICSPRAR